MPYFLLLPLALLLALATLIEHFYGSEAARSLVYTSPPVIIIWMLLAGTAFLTVCRRLRFRRRPATYLLHLNFVIILAGAFVTHLRGEDGTLALREGAPAASGFFTHGEQRVAHLPFKIRLIETECAAAGNMRCVVEINDGGCAPFTAEIAVNRILSHKSHRLTLASIAPGRVTLLVNHDPWGIALTYVGYTLLFMSAIAWLFEPSSQWRAALNRWRAVPAALPSSPQSSVGGRKRQRWRARNVALNLSLIALLAYAAVRLSIRAVATAEVPMATAHDSLTLMAALVVIPALALQRRFTPALWAGGALSLLCLLAAGPPPPDNALPPVLRSPLLGLHVGVIIAAYALLAFLALNSALALALRKRRCGASRCLSAAPASDAFARSTLIARILLPPAILLLVAGIFLGAVWANQSWGRYWGWDAKETWALVTLLVYTLPLHASQIRPLRKPRNFHLYLLLAFVSVLITYFGVNFFLSGLHSYAG